uniref:Cathepsin propeptide inhibitor domain-containing protein n=1 Tax=Biomphalaria glabrata TaxID=6526 RepID=A0A2C9L320_BIOGL
MLFSSVLFCCTVLVLATEATQEKEAEQRYWDVIKKDVERDLNTEKAERNFWDIVKERAERNFWDIVKERVERDLNTEKAERNFWDIVKERTARNFWRLSPEERKRDLENEDYIDQDGLIVLPYDGTVCTFLFSH